MSGPGYIAGDHWRICDRCGFQVRSSQTSKTWDGLWVCEADFETRHPQDFVRGRKDTINVPEPRPDQIPVIVGPLTTTTTLAAAPSDTTINVESSVRFFGSDVISLMTSSGDAKRFTILSIPTATSIALSAPLGASVPAGSLVTNFTAVSQVDIG